MSRTTGVERLRILVGYYNFPEWDRYAGALRELDIVRLLAQRGHRVTFLAMNSNGRRYRKELERHGIKCLADDDGTLRGNSRTFASKAGKFDVAILSHDWVFAAYEPVIRAASPGCTCVFDTIDLQFVRLEREATLGLISRQEVEDKGHVERAALKAADEIWVVTSSERQRLGDLDLAECDRIHVVPCLHQNVKERRPLTERDGVIFLGGYGHRPNVDAIHYFMREIEPAVRRQLPKFQFSIVGSSPPPEFSHYARSDDLVKVVGYVDDHRAALSEARVGVAPLRFGAGMKGKIGEYLSCGLPCVTTSIGAEGMGLREGIEALIADHPESFANAVARLQTDGELWEAMSRAGMDYIQREYSPEAVGSQLCTAIQSAAARRQPLAAPQARGYVSQKFDGLRRWWGKRSETSAGSR